MKKLCIIMMAVMAVVMFTAPSFAKNQVQMTLTSPTIYKEGCEKIGSTTYSFQENSVINSGDWWYMDLPENVSICKDYNYVIAGRALAEPTITLPAVSTTNAYENVTFTGGAIGTLSVTGTTEGPLTVTGAGAITSTGQMAFLVKGVKNSRRITVYALTAGTTPNLAVAVDQQLQFNLFDGQAHAAETFSPLNTCILLPGTTDATENIYTTPIVDDFPNVENTLCANAETYTSQYVYTSYASKDDNITFSGDAQIAHTGSSDITLEACVKDDTIPTIEIEGEQGVCFIEYESVASDSYCDSSYQNRFVIQANTGAFGDVTDTFTLTATIEDPNEGVYFSGAPSVRSYINSENACEDVGTAVSTSFAPMLSETEDATAYPGTTSCTIEADEQVIIADGSASGFQIPAGADKLFVNFSPFVFDNTVVTEAEEVIVNISLSKAPCGVIFEESRTIGTFVTTCPSQSATTLYFPWLPGSGAGGGWWGGYTVTNITADAGTASLTLRDSDGNSATATQAVAAGELIVLSSAISADDLTDVDSANPYDPTINYSVIVECDFGARGFAFTGDSVQGVGYTADYTDE